MKTKNNKLKPGDCFQLKISKNNFVYFQFITRDEEMLQSDCIRFFKLIRNKPLDLNQIILIENSETWFYSHTYVEEDLYKNIEFKFIDNIKLPTNEELNKVIFHNIIELPSGNKWETFYRIRKINQKVEDSNVKFDEYIFKSRESWRDGVSGLDGLAHKIQLKIKDSSYKYLY